MTLVGSWLTGRHQVNLAGAARTHGVRDRQFELHMRYLQTADHVLGECRRVMKLSSSTTLYVSEGAELTRLSESWNGLLDSRAGAQMAGPNELLQTMSPFQIALNELHDFLETNGRSVPEEQRMSTAKEKWAATVTARSNYVKDASVRLLR